MSTNRDRMGTPIYDELCRYNDRRWIRTLTRWAVASVTVFTLAFLATILLDWLILWRSSF